MKGLLRHVFEFPLTAMARSDPTPLAHGNYHRAKVTRDPASWIQRVRDAFAEIPSKDIASSDETVSRAVRCRLIAKLPNIVAELYEYIILEVIRGEVWSQLLRKRIIDTRAKKIGRA